LNFFVILGSFKSCFSCCWWTLL